jgi:glycosyltransferase involved in cell wall biosynthesis
MRKYDPRAWGGTETVLLRLVAGLREDGVASVLFAPRIHGTVERDAFAEAGFDVRRFRAYLPVVGIPADMRRKLHAVGGNIVSLDAGLQLLREPDLDVVHSHALLRLGGIARLVARRRGLPFVVSIHGGYLDLPEAARADLVAPLSGGIEWGRVLGLLLRSQRVVEDADAVIAVNAEEARRVAERHPGKRVLHLPHGVPVAAYERDQRAAALAAWPELGGRPVILALGRIDAVKGQAWLVERAPRLFIDHPAALVVMAGAVTDEAYAARMRLRARELGAEDRVRILGGLAPADPRLIGLLQLASVVVAPSLSETFGLVLLEAWSAGTPVLSSPTSGAKQLVRDGENGFLFPLEEPEVFHRALGRILGDAELRTRLAEAGRRLAGEHYDTRVLTRRTRELYEDLVRARRSAHGKPACATS